VRTGLSQPITGIAGCCARAASGHAAAAPPSSVIKSRRFTADASGVSDRNDSTLRYGSRLLRCGISVRPMSQMVQERRIGAVRNISAFRPTSRRRRWGNRPASFWIAEEFGVLRFRLMAKRGPHLRPQASEGEAQHGLFVGLDVSVKETSVCSCMTRASHRIPRS
jgi:hypothetical protein